MANQAILRISKDLRDVKNGSDISLSVAFRDQDMRRVRAMIVGPPETPYEFGFFEFDFKFPNNYPTNPPQVKCLTTDGGRTRFNPNIYADGKVCLSILGTWHGEKGEEWSTVQSLETVLLSIQSLLSSNPWENEPGFEKPTGRPDESTSDDADDETDSQGSDATGARDYAAKIRHETINISVIKRLERCLKIEGPLRRESEGLAEAFGSDEIGEGIFEPFVDFCKRRFLWYYHSYLNTVELAGREVGTSRFRMAPFESPDNGMVGSFEYKKLRSRLQTVYNALNQETSAWIKAGADEAARESTSALEFRNKFQAAAKKLKQQERPLDLDLVDDNPFVWQVTLFGKPMTNLDGGVFKIRLVFSSKFPEEQPRVNVLTPLFHQRVAPDGTLCYFPKSDADPSSHIDAIVAAIEDERPAYDPRTRVNPEAASLLWGTEEEKRSYNRRLRRSAQESSEHI